MTDMNSARYVSGQLGFSTNGLPAFDSKASAPSDSFPLPHPGWPRRRLQCRFGLRISPPLNPARSPLASLSFAAVERVRGRRDLFPGVRSRQTDAAAPLRSSAQRAQRCSGPGGRLRRETRRGPARGRAAARSCLGWVRAECPDEESRQRNASPVGPQATMEGSLNLIEVQPGDQAGLSSVQSGQGAACVIDGTPRVGGGGRWRDSFKERHII